MIENMLEKTNTLYDNDKQFHFNPKQSQKYCIILSNIKHTISLTETKS